MLMKHDHYRKPCKVLIVDFIRALVTFNLFVILNLAYESTEITSLVRLSEIKPGLPRATTTWRVRFHAKIKWYKFFWAVYG